MNSVLNSAAKAAHNVVRRALSHADAVAPGLVRAYDARLMRYRLRHALGYEPNLEHPRTYNEKVAWRILHDRNPLIAATTDKVAVRAYVAGKVGPDILVPLLGVYDRVEDVPWDDLPNRFALKASHGYAMNQLITDKSSTDRGAALAQADEWLHRQYYARSREWAYRDIPPRLIVEELLLDEQGRIPSDFKFLVFHGKAALIRVHLDRFGRFGEHLVNFYDTDLNLLALTQIEENDPSYVLPPGVRDMIPVAEHLAEDFDYARIDLYLVGDTIKFGEITHYDGSAQAPYVPVEFDRTLGELWQLPHDSRGRVTPSGQAPRR